MRNIEEISYKDFIDYEDMLDQLQDHINQTIDAILDAVEKDDDSIEDVYNQHEVIIEMNGKRFNLGSGDAEHNGLLEFVSFVRGQQ